MSKKVVYINDFFLEDFIGGGELNDHELLAILDKDYDVQKIRSNDVTIDFLKENKNSFFIISNFINLKISCKDYINDLNYVIYEHDHKYVKSRNPAVYKDFKAGISEIINYHFYKNAKAVLCQSKFHKEIIEKNLDISNVVNLAGNLWSIETLEYIRKISKNKKNNTCAILQSQTPHKNTQGAIDYCNQNSLKYNLISNSNYKEFLRLISTNEKFVFLPKSPETLSRITLEARMLGCSIATNSLVGATSEQWFSLKGEELIDFLIEKRKDIKNIVIDIIESDYEKIKKPKISIISTFYKAEFFLEQFLDDITNQTIFSDCELILIDSASPGNEQEIVSKYTAKYKNIIYKRYNELFPPTEGHNIAMKMASGKYITLAMIDDRKRKDSLEILYKTLENNPDIDLAYGDCIVTNVKNETFDKTVSTIKSEHSIAEFSAENMVKCLPGPMPMWTRKMVDAAGFFDHENQDFCDDWEMWLRCVSYGFKFKKVNEPIGLYLEGGRSQLENNIEQRKEEAALFFKYGKLFGQNFNNYYPYFKQFMDLT